MSGPDVRKPGEDPAGSRNSELEWAVAGLGLVLLTFTVGFMLFRAFSGGDAPPQVTLRVLETKRSGDGFLVRIAAHNTGDEAAAELGVEGTVTRNGSTVETSETTFDFLPADSVREGGLFFSEDPRGALALRAVGFREP